MAEDMQSDEQGMDAKMDPTALVREDVISDRRVGTIRMLTPITVEGDHRDLHSFPTRRSSDLCAMRRAMFFFLAKRRL